MDIFNSIKINRLCPVVAILDLLSRLLWTLCLMSRLHSRRASTRTTEPKNFLHLSFFGAKQFQFLGAEQTQKLWRRRCHKRFSIIKIGRRLFTPPILSISRAHWREKVKCSRRAFFLNWRAFSLATVAFLRPRFLHVYNYHFPVTLQVIVLDLSNTLRQPFDAHYFTFNERPGWVVWRWSHHDT